MIVGVKVRIYLHMTIEIIVLRARWLRFESIVHTAMSIAQDWLTNLMLLVSDHILEISICNTLNLIIAP